MDSSAYERQKKQRQRDRRYAAGLSATGVPVARLSERGRRIRAAILGARAVVPPKKPRPKKGRNR